MIVEFPDHFASNVGGALVERGAQVIGSNRMVPAYLHQFAVLWDKGLAYGYAGTYWEAIVESHPDLKGLVDNR